jgi:hypothetical protein
MYIVVFVVAFAVIVSVLLVPDITITGNGVTLGSRGYDIRPVDTPVVNGWALDAFAYLTTRTRAGPLIRRLLLNANGVAAIRDLAAQVKQPPMYYPMRRVSRERLLATTLEESEHELAAILQSGVDGNGLSLNAAGRSVDEYARYYRLGNGLPSEVLGRTLRQLQQWESESNFKIFSDLHEQEVLEQARASDARFRAGTPLSVLDGVPVAMKDMLCVAGHFSFGGHRDSPSLCAEDDIIVKRLRSLGAIVLGVTIQVEGGVTPLGYNAHWQGPVSPFSHSRYSGGSSSGAGVVVGSGIVPIAIGFDGGGSVRSPG